MQIILMRLIAPALTFISIRLLFANIEKHNNNELIKNLSKEHIIILLPKAYMWVGFIGVLVFSSFMILMSLDKNNDTATTWVWILFCSFDLLGVSIMVATKTWRIEIFRTKDYFLYRTVFFRTYKILYTECISYKFDMFSMILKTDKKTFHIDGRSRNFEFLLSMLSTHGVVSNE